MAEPKPYGRTTRWFHWGTAALVAVMIPAGILMTSEGFVGLRDALYIAHKGTGVLLLLVVFGRVGWMLLARNRPEAAAGLPPRQQRLARTAHRTLYVLLVVMVVSGYTRTVGHGYPIELLDLLGIPPLIPEVPRIAAAASVIHKVTAYLLTAVIAVHVGAIAHQTMVVGDDTLARMWPGRHRREAPDA